ncbi:MAG: hypothetical protein LBC99_00255 [Spirochaetota bacterium]|jgi:V/A-type H+-transporting ATPase subunit I|nr:hypothetical protein [Spirochaetota bacterium]
MFKAARMTMVDILVFEPHVASLVRSLGEAGVCELIHEQTEPNARYEKELEEITRRVESAESAMQSYALPWDNLSRLAVSATEDLSGAFQNLDELTDAMEPLRAAAETEKQRQDELRNILHTVVGFRSLDIEFSALREMTHVSLRYGSVPEEKLASLLAAGGKALVLPLDIPADHGRRSLLAASSRTGRFSMDTLLSDAGFRDTPLPEMSGNSDSIIRQLEESLRESREASQAIERQKEKLLLEKGSGFIKALAALKQKKCILSAMRGFTHTASTCHIRCWVERSKFGELEKLVADATEGCGVVEGIDPNSLPHSRRKALDIPIVLRNNRFLKPFEAFIRNYGYPRYGEIEPTPLTAIGFVIMFGLMFGDVGQGFVLLLAGLWIYLGKSFPAALRQTGMVVISAGISAMFFGCMFGSVFCMENVIHPLWREPLASYGNILMLFGASILFGVLWISVGIICNIINRLYERDFEDALLGKTGFAGLAFYWGTVIPIGLALTGVIGGPDILTLIISSGIPLLLIVAREPLWGALTSGPLFAHGAVTWVFEAIVEMLDTVMYFFGNTFSFVRMGAFTLAHAGLSMAVIELAGLVGGGAAGLLALIFGNLLIIVLEGMVVTIQSLRLEYYEFFSKFYSGSGRGLVPFKLPFSSAS